MKVATDTKILLIGAVLAIGGVWYVSRQIRGVAGSAGKVVSDAYDWIGVNTKGAWVNDAAGRFVQGAGAAIGIPRTNADDCRRAIAEGRTWDASFACPAGTFLSSVFGSADVSEADRPIVSGGGGVFAGNGATGSWGDDSVRQAQQADVRRIDNQYGY